MGRDVNKIVGEVGIVEVKRLYLELLSLRIYFRVIF